MNRAVETIMELTGCSEDDAQRVYAETNDVTDAVDRLMPKYEFPSSKYIKKAKPVRVYTEEENAIKELRGSLKAMDEEHAKRSISSNQPEHEEQVGHCTPHEETAQQSSCYQECQIPALAAEAQKQETACQSLSECSFYSP